MLPRPSLTSSHGSGPDLQALLLCADEAQGEVSVPSRRILLEFAVPLAAVTVAAPVLSGIDTAFVGRCASTLELAALGPACTVADLMYLICEVVSTAAIKSYADIRTDIEQRKRLGSTCIFVATCIGLIFATISVTCHRPLLVGLSATPEMMPVASSFIIVRAFSLPMASVAAAMYGLCVGQEDTSTPFVVTVVLQAAANILGDCVLVAWGGCGATGAAWATVAAQTTGLLAYIGIMRSKGMLPLPELSKFLPTWPEAQGVLQIYVPVSMVVMCVLSMYAGMSAFVNRTQPVSIVAAYKVTISIFAFVALCSDPLAAATTTKLPPVLARLGSQAAHTFLGRAASCALAVGFIGACMGAGILRFAPFIFTRDESVSEACQLGLAYFVAILTVMHPTRVFQNALVAHGDYAYYIIAQAVASLMFFAGLYQMGIRAYIMVASGESTSSAAYVSMWRATLVFYVVSFVIFAGRVLMLNSRLPMNGKPLKF